MTVKSFREAVTLCRGKPRLIIDLSCLHSVDADGLTVLIGATRSGEERGTMWTWSFLPGKSGPCLTKPLQLFLDRKDLHELGLDLDNPEGITDE